MTTLSFLPRKVRSLIYAVVTLLGVAVAGCEAGFKAIAQADPAWLSFAAGALVPLSIAAGAVALSNVTPASPGAAGGTSAEVLPRRDDLESGDRGQVDGPAGAGIVFGEDQLVDHSTEVYPALATL